MHRKISKRNVWGINKRVYLNTAWHYKSLFGVKWLAVLVFMLREWWKWQHTKDWFARTLAEIKGCTRVSFCKVTRRFFCLHVKHTQDFSTSSDRCKWNKLQNSSTSTESFQSFSPYSTSPIIARDYVWVIRKKSATRLKTGLRFFWICIYSYSFSVRFAMCWGLFLN